MTGRIQWRRFAFFDKEIIAENVEKDLGGKITCAAAEGGSLFLGNDLGTVLMADRSFKILWKHKVFKKGVFGISYIFDTSNERRQFVIAAGDDGIKTNASISIQYVVKVLATSDMSRPLHTIVINPIAGGLLTSFAVYTDGSRFAVGFSSGQLLLYTGSFFKEGSLGKQQIPLCLLPGGDGYPISSLFFCELPIPVTYAPSTQTSTSTQNTPITQQNEKQIRLFVVTDTESSEDLNEPPDTVPPVQSSPSSSSNPFDELPPPPPTPAQTQGPSISLNRQVRGPPSAGIQVFSIVPQPAPTQVPGRCVSHILDDRGVPAGRAALTQETCELIVARPEGLFSFSVEDRGGAAGFEGEKTCLCASARYILVSGSEEKSQKNSITAYDLRNKLIGLSHPLGQGEKVKFLFRDGGTSVSFALTSTNSLIRFKEKETSGKIEVLLRKSLFPLALTIAAEEQSDPAEIMKLYKLYGDSLYKKGDFSGAMSQYKLTAGALLSSYVIRKFLDPQRISELVIYLETLVEKGVANEDHIHLLLGCYARTKDIQKLLAFATTEEAVAMDRRKTQDGSTAEASAVGTLLPLGILAMFEKDKTKKPGQHQLPDFRLDTILDVLISSGYRDIAVRLALAKGDHLSYLKIQLMSPVPDVDNAIYYLTGLTVRLDADDLLRILKEYGGCVLVATFLRPFQVIQFRPLIRSRGETMTALLSRLCLGKIPPTLSLPPDRTSMARLPVTEVMRLFCSPSSFENKNEGTSLLREFLEQVLEQGGSRALPQTAANTLIEQHLAEYGKIKKEIDLQQLTTSTAFKATNTTERKDSPETEIEPASSHSTTLIMKLHQTGLRVLGLLDDSNLRYDTSVALLNTSIYGFEEGRLLLLGKQEHQHEIPCSSIILQTFFQVHTLRSCPSNGAVNDEEVFNLLKKEGKRNPELYCVALEHFLDRDRLSLPRTPRMPSSQESTVGLREQRYDTDAERWRCVERLLTLLTDRWQADPASVSQNPTPNYVLSILSSHTELPLSIASSFIKSNIAGVSQEVYKLSTSVNQLQNTVMDLRRIEMEKRKASDKFLQTAKNNEQSSMKPRASTANPDVVGAGKSSNPWDDEGADGTSDTEGESTIEKRNLNVEVDKDQERLEQQQRRKWEGIRKAQAERASDHEALFAELEGSEDGFAAAANYFGKLLIA